MLELYTVRDPRWEQFKLEYLQSKPKCLACNRKASVQIHHIFPVNYCVALGRPDLELDKRNLIPLCETQEGENAANHHLLLGHLGNFKSGNLNVLKDVKIFYGKNATELTLNKKWLKKKNKRLKPLEEMTRLDKRILRAKMDRKFPKKRDK